jgi:hypothetical protein
MIKKDRDVEVGSGGKGGSAEEGEEGKQDKELLHVGITSLGDKNRQQDTPFHGAREGGKIRRARWHLPPGS